MTETPMLPSDRPKKAVFTLVILCVLAGAGFLGYQKFMDWHEKTLETALSVQQQEFAEKEAALIAETERLEAALVQQAPPQAAPERLAEIFGTPEAGTPESPEDTCVSIAKRLQHFFTYLETHAPEPASSGFLEFPQGMVRLLARISARLPMITDETKDIISLKHNEAHFFRVLGKEGIQDVLKLMAADEDVLEPALADFYAYYVEKNCCTAESGAPCASLDTLYTYAGFFLETFAGKSYLFRRSARQRVLAEYYAVRILDRAGAAGINPYGIDIRPHIDRTLDSLRSQTPFLFQDAYETTLLELREKYRAEYSPEDIS